MKHSQVRKRALKLKCSIYKLKAFGGAGQSHVNWVAKIAVGMDSGVPWVMCKEDDAPDPMVLDNLPHDIVYSPDQVSPWTQQLLEVLHWALLKMSFIASDFSNLPDIKIAGDRVPLASTKLDAAACMEEFGLP